MRAAQAKSRQILQKIISSPSYGKILQETIITHRAITKSIAEHDPVGARSAMTMHISYNRAAIKEIYDARNRELENQEQ